MKIHAYAAELLGTFLLALLVHLSLGSSFPVPTPVVAGLTLGLIVYMFGSVSGAHVNPAVTVGLAVIHKISWNDAAAYIVMQLTGGLLAMMVGNTLMGTQLDVIAGNTLSIGIAEALGAAILVLGVSSVVLGKAPKEASGLTIGTALTLGALTASSVSNGVVNPAVAVGIGSVSLAYIVGPLVGGAIAAFGYRALIGKS
ncbi:MAG TPA: aquaporin [Candidatus Peribacterales bacterium]|nr:aquaporin [Candidatus Peribacterales bacterium]